MKRNRDSHGAGAFDAFYASQYGERWRSLREALLRPPRQVARRHHLASPVGTASEPAGDALPWLPGCSLLGGDSGTGAGAAGAPAEVPLASAAPGLLGTYRMDAASVLAARALHVGPGDRVLDMCAAPGGKTLILAEGIAERGELVANELSSSRRARLHEVLAAYLPPGVLERVRVTAHDATRWGLHEPESRDRVLVDAPCSSERHVLRLPAALATWSPARSRQLLPRQRALLAAAVDVCRPGGRIVYSTCAIAPDENDGVVERVLDRRRGRVVSVSGNDLARFGEPTRTGVAILPDRDGWGPLFIAVLERI